MSKTIFVSLQISVVSILSWIMLAMFASPAFAQPGRLQNVLQQVDAQRLASEARLRGDSRRGAIVFHTSAAACVKCHQSGAGKSPLGPDLAQLGEKITDIHLVESLLNPSKSIRVQGRTRASTKKKLGLQG